MSRVRLFDPRDVRAIRIDAVGSGPGVERHRRRIDRTVVAPYRVLIQIGEEPKRDVEHMDVGDFRRSFSRRKRWVRRAPTCRACGKPIEHGERTIQFSLYSSPDSPNCRTAYVHEEVCPS